MVICLERGADLHMAQLMPLPLTVSCFSKVGLVLPFWYQLTWKRAVKRVCVCSLHPHALLYSTVCSRLFRCVCLFCSLTFELRDLWS